MDRISERFKNSVEWPQRWKENPFVSRFCCYFATEIRLFERNFEPLKMRVFSQIPQPIERM
jgi:hypothetical protein